MTEPSSINLRAMALPALLLAIFSACPVSAQGVQSTGSTDARDSATLMPIEASTVAVLAKDDAKNAPVIAIKSAKKKAPTRPGLVRRVLEPVTELQTQSIRLQEQIVKLEKPIESLQPPMIRLHERFLAVESQMKDLQSSLIGIKTQLNTVHGDISVVWEQVSKLEKPIGALHDPVTKIYQPIADLQKPLQGLRGQLDQLHTQMTRLEKPINALNQPIVQLTAPVIALHDPMVGLKTEMTGLHQDISNLKNELSGLSSSLNKVTYLIEIGLVLLGLWIVVTVPTLLFVAANKIKHSFLHTAVSISPADQRLMDEAYQKQKANENQSAKSDQI